MLNPDVLERSLCSRFCAGVSVRTVSDGLAISTVFCDVSGDRIGFYAIPEVDGWRLEDDGEFLSMLMATGVDIEDNQRGQLLDQILDQSDAYWDRDSLVIRSGRCYSDSELDGHLLPFLSGLLRARDLGLMTREVVRTTFRDDARAAIVDQLGEMADIEEGAAIDDKFKDYPSDLVLRPKEQGRPAAVFVVTRNERLTEALLLQAEALARGRRDFAVVALMEEPEFKGISRRNLQRAQNRLAALPVFRGDEDAAVQTIARVMALAS